MFQKRLLELFTLIFYWLVAMKWIYAYAKDSGWLVWSMDAFGNTVNTHALFLLVLIVGYVILYRIVMFSYMKCKVCDIQMWHQLKKIKEDPEAQVQQQRLYKSVDIDTVDGGRMIRTISNPLLVEDDLARIHVKHETRPLGSATLPAQLRPKQRTAPPVPLTPPGMARKLSHGIIMTPDVLLSAQKLRKMPSQASVLDAV